MSLNELTIKKANAGLQKKEFSSVELTKACLDRIKKTDEKIKKAESFLSNMGFYNLRVRYHNRHSEFARIEIDTNDFGIAIDKKNRQRIVEGLKKLGFKYITLDLEGFRSGSMDELDVLVLKIRI